MLNKVLLTYFFFTYFLIQLMNYSIECIWRTIVLDALEGLQFLIQLMNYIVLDIFGGL